MAKLDAYDIGVRKVCIRYKPFIHFYLYWLKGQQLLYNAFKT